MPLEFSIIVDVMMVAVFRVFRGVTVNITVMITVMK